MRESSLEYLRCVNCKSALDLNIFSKKTEIEEGFLGCGKCGLNYPIISRVPLMLKDLSLYLTIRRKLGGELMLLSKNASLRNFVKNSLRKVGQEGGDTTNLERDWVKIYSCSKTSRFYKHIKEIIRRLPTGNLSLEHGCSIGYMSAELAQKSEKFFGVDKSFYGIVEAKRIAKENSDFIVADSLNAPFGDRKFDHVMALNMLDIVKPREFLNAITSQASNFLILSDPYDFKHEKNSSDKINSKDLRKFLECKGFRLANNTKKPSFISWMLHVNPRLDLNYLVDVVIAERVLI